MADRSCETCGTPVSQIGRGRPRRFCIGCRPPTYTPKPPEHRAPKPPMVKPPRWVACIECGERFQTKAPAKSCASCAPARRRRQNADARKRASVAARAERSCDACFGPLAPRRWKRCSPACAEEARRHTRAGWPPNACALHIRSCLGCGCALIIRRETGPNRKKCDACAVPEVDRLRARRAARREAVKAGEVVRLADVAERDDHRCRICGDTVPLTSWPDPTSASLDHIIPLSKGGEHTMANTQLAHLACNMSKGDRLPAG